MRVVTRPAETKDIDWLIGQLAEFAEALPGMVQFPDRAYCESTLGQIMQVGVLLIAERGEERMGFIMGVKSNHLMNPYKSVLSELAWWVTPEHRKGRAGYMLLKHFVEIAKTSDDIDMVAVSLEENSKVSENTLTRFGLKRAERTFYAEVT